MDCPHCHSSSIREREGRTVQGFRRYGCRDCGRRYNERTGTVLNRVQVPTDIVFLVVFWRLRDKLNLRDLAGALAKRRFSHFVGDASCNQEDACGLEQ
jgi:putative transposase